MTELNILSAELPHCNPVMPDRIFMIIICSIYLSFHTAALTVPLMSVLCAVAVFTLVILIEHFWQLRRDIV